MPVDRSVIALVMRARDGDKSAWDEIVERYAPLVWSICRRFRLDPSTAADVGQSVWLRLVEQLPALRDPAALPGWLATTTRRECLHVLQASQRRKRFERSITPDVVRLADIPTDATVIEEELLAAERNVALRLGFAQLPSRCQRLLALLLADPPVPYVEISARLGVPVGSIGPIRARCLDKLRRYPSIAALMDAAARSDVGGST